MDVAQKRGARDEFIFPDRLCSCCRSRYLEDCNPPVLYMLPALLVHSKICSKFLPASGSGGTLCCKNVSRQQPPESNHARTMPTPSPILWVSEMRGRGGEALLRRGGRQGEGGGGGGGLQPTRCGLLWSFTTTHLPDELMLDWLTQRLSGILLTTQMAHRHAHCCSSV